MKKTLLLTLILLPFLTNAQSTRTQKTEIEVGANLTFAAGKNGAKEITYGVTGYLEIRYNIKKLPLDFGFRTELERYQKSYIQASVPYKFWPISFLGVANYSFFRGAKVNPYAGFSMGLLMNIDSSDCDDCFKVMESDWRKPYFSFAPQVGVKFFDRFNLSIGYTLTNARRDYQHATVRLGVYF